ncbi:polymerase [Mesorhizobium sp. M0751]|uniref:polymerase n=1 Tax=unclassified Mesorhizobium TaxID=325217 RepID=UPI003339797C
MRYGEIFANVTALMLLALMIGGVFVLFGEPLWPRHYARMVLVTDIDAMTTASVRTSCSSTPCLPDTVDRIMLTARPQDGP